MNKSKIQNITLSLLQEHDLLSVPIDITKLTSKLGIQIKRDNFDEVSLSGFAVHKLGNRYIGVNSNESENRQRFTIAHELGHLFLHKDSTVNYDQGGMMLFRDAHSSEGTDIREVEANKFAAEILMPEVLLRDDISKEKNFDLINRDATTQSVIGRLADKYQVSEQAMSIRLATLYFN